MKKMLLSLFVLGITVSSVVGITVAFFSDTETSTSNSFTAGSLDLLVDNQSYYNGQQSPETSWTLTNLQDHKFFNFSDLKPGDWGEDTISLHVNDNNAWMCLDVNLTSNDENGLVEPEAQLGDTEDDTDFDGELAQNVNFIFWVDDGDNVLEDNETVFKSGSALEILNGITWTIADSVSNIFGFAGPLLGGQTYHLGKAWCFGELTQSPLPEGSGIDPTVSSGIVCNGNSLDNSTQTDILTGDISFTVEQARNNSSFVCRPQNCQEVYASGFTDNNQGIKKDGGTILANRKVPSAMFGPPQSTGTIYDTPVDGSFFSLGFTEGNIVLSFTNPIFNQAGPDLAIFEVTGGSNYPDEKVKIEASQNGTAWVSLSASSTRDTEVDLGALPWARFVRLTDVSDIAAFEPAADGYDVDAVKAFCGTP